jgi:gliding motility-associated-like protein
VAAFEWNFGNSATPTTSTAENPININFADTGKYDVFLTIRENGCESTIKKPIYVYPHPRPKFGLDGYVQCSPYRLAINDSSFAKTPLSYIWEFGNGDSSTSEFPFYIYTDSGSYNIGLTVITKNGCVDTVKTDYPINVKVNPTPVANFSVFPLETSIFEPEITFTNLANLGLDCYIFTGDGIMLNSCDSTYSYLNPGVYSAAQVVKNSSGCSDTLFQNLEITGEFAFFAPNAFTPNGDGQNDFFKPVIYGIESYQLSIYDRWGRVVFKTTSNSKGWDGRIGRKIAAQNESYTWRVDAIDYLGNNQLFIGNVILAR